MSSLSVPYGRNSWISWSAEPASRLLVFVHGLRGSADRTWGRIPVLAVNDPHFEGLDIAAFDYECQRRQVQIIASELRRFLSDCAERLPVVARASGLGGQMAAERSVHEILIVAHSLGAVVVRRALLDGLRMGEDWPGVVRLLLFAPAHMGARVEVLLSMTLGAVLRPFEALIRTLYPCLDELEYDSATLAVVRSATEESLAEGYDCHIAAVGLAEDEQVVETVPFLRDWPGEVIRGSNHLSCCKALASTDQAYNVIRLWISQSTRS